MFLIINAALMGMDVSLGELLSNPLKSTVMCHAPLGTGVTRKQGDEDDLKQSSLN